MSNLYHVNHRKPVLQQEGLERGYEKLAQAITNSGLLRIDAYNKINFARFSIPSQAFNKMFSVRELYKKDLLPNTRFFIGQSLRRIYDSKDLDKQIDRSVEILRAELKKYQPVDEELELKLARVLVQSAHPVIIELILIEKVEIFVSYSHTIGDMLDTYSWQLSGTNSGMQSTDTQETSIFVSCGGDPFGQTQNSHFGDGDPALARMAIIAAQEIGHYSDLIRNDKGEIITRFSMELNGYRAKEPVRTHGINDIKHVQNIYRLFHNNFFFKALYSSEEALKFFRKNKRRDFTILYTLMKTFSLRFIVEIYLKYNFKIILTAFEKNKYLALDLIDMLKDMKFNLEPQADVYRNSNKSIEEAIQCAEALARVPQQVIKWGHQITNFIYPNLYKFYYNALITSNIKTYQSLTSLVFKFDNRKIKIPLYRKIFKYIFRYESSPKTF